MAPSDASLVLLEDLDVPQPVFPNTSRLWHTVVSVFEEYSYAILRKFNLKTHFGTDTNKATAPLASRARVKGSGTEV